MIVGNGVRLNGNPCRLLAAPLSNNLARSNWNESGALRNVFTAPGASRKDGIPSGMRHPHVWLLPKTAGGLASRFLIEGGGATTGNLAGGVNGTATIAGVGNFMADAALLGFLTAAILGEGSTVLTASALAQALSDLHGFGDLTPGLTSVLNTVAELAGSSAVVGDAVATLVAIADLHGDSATTAYLAGAILAGATLTGTGVSTATLDAITDAVATLDGAGSIPPATLTALGLALTTLTGAGVFDAAAVAKGSMGAVISLVASQAELSPDAVAASVKASLLDTTLATDLIRKLLQNRTHTDPDTGVMTVFDDDDETPLLTAHVYEDVDGTEPYAVTSNRIDRRDRLT